MTRRVNRRIFLRGLGGACVAAPFLGSLLDRRVAAQPAPSPKRLIVMFTHYGCITNRFFPAKSHGPLGATDLEPTTLKHLIPYVDKLLMPRGIRAMNEWTPELLRGQGNDRHLQVLGSYFTCEPVTPNTDNPFDFAQETKFNAKPMGPSLDHVIARQLTPGRPPLYARVGNGTYAPSSTISYSAAETVHQGYGKPNEIFASITGLLDDGGSLSPDTYQAYRGRSVIDLVKDDLETLERFDMSKSDRNKLEAWKSLLHETGTIIASAQCSAEADALYEPSLTFRSGPTDTESDVLTASVTDVLDQADLYSNLAVLAALCNVNPVVFLKYPNNFIFTGLGLTIESASLSYRVGNANLVGNCEPGVIDMLLKIDDYYARKFAYLVGRLDSFDEGDGTLLDNTAAVWFQDSSDGCARNLNNLPIVQVGSAGGYFKTGWAVNVDDGAPDLSVGNSESACAPGTPSEIDATTMSTGTDPSLANAPINKYYCALMNALGVKAGEDGFPLEGGTEEVTHFGRYDRTEDFIGGGSVPPQIHDPGEFSELRAAR